MSSPQETELYATLDDIRDSGMSYPHHRLQRRQSERVIPSHTHTPLDKFVIPDPHNHIQVHRSDGMHHDLITVFKSYSESTNLVRPHPTGTVTVNATDDEDMPSIRISRSDGEHHDLSRLPVIAEDEPSTPRDADNIQITAQSDLFCSLAVRIVHMSNTHNQLDAHSSKKILPHGNILIHSGDFSVDGKVEEFKQFDSWLRSVSSIYHIRIIVLGQSDTKIFGTDWSRMAALLPHATHVLCNSEIRVLGLHIYGAPYQKPPKRSLFGKNSNIYSSIPSCDILITHEAAYGKLDNDGAQHAGNRNLAEVLKHHRPGVHLHGSVLQSRGVSFPMSREPLVVNSCMTDPTKTILYGIPHVIKCSQVSVREANIKTWLFSVAAFESSVA